MLDIRDIYIKQNAFCQTFFSVHFPSTQMGSLCNEGMYHLPHLNHVRSCSHFTKGSLCRGRNQGGPGNLSMYWEGHLLNLCSMQKGEFSSPWHPEMFGLFTLPLKWNVAPLLAHGKMTTWKGQPVLHIPPCYREWFKRSFHKLHGNINDVILCEGKPINMSNLGSLWRCVTLKVK
jgi:hypothetical protein